MNAAKLALKFLAFQVAGGIAGTIIALVVGSAILKPNQQIAGFFLGMSLALIGTFVGTAAFHRAER